MKQVEEWLERYLEICRHLLAKLSADAGHYSDDKLSAVEAALDMRQEMLEELGGMTLGEEARLLYSQWEDSIRKNEAEIESAVRDMMDEMKAEQAVVHDQRAELNRQKRANRSYAGIQRSVEGYFIDKKK